MKRSCLQVFLMHVTPNAEVSRKLSAQMFGGTHHVIVLSIAREREMAYVWCSVHLCLHTWWVQPNLGGRVAV